MSWPLGAPETLVVLCGTFGPQVPYQWIGLQIYQITTVCKFILWVFNNSVHFLS